MQIHQNESLTAVTRQVVAHATGRCNIRTSQQPSSTTRPSIRSPQQRRPRGQSVSQWVSKVVEPIKFLPYRHTTRSFIALCISSPRVGAVPVTVGQAGKRAIGPRNGVKQQLPPRR